jgi:hypothetical protein
MYYVLQRPTELITLSMINPSTKLQLGNRVSHTPWTQLQLRDKVNKTFGHRYNLGTE